MDCMNARDYLCTYIDSHGGIAATAARLGVAYSTLASIRNGYRGISTRMATRMAQADPFLDANRLVWVRATKKDAKRSAASVGVVNVG